MCRGVEGSRSDLLYAGVANCCYGAKGGDRGRPLGTREQRFGDRVRQMVTS